ncbi:Protein nedd1 [Geranomyces variabilis]|nr:Protein nedd1 [Geranomyces variabilis]
MPVSQSTTATRPPPSLSAAVDSGAAASRARSAVDTRLASKRVTAENGIAHASSVAVPSARGASSSIRASEAPPPTKRPTRAAPTAGHDQEVMGMFSPVSKTADRAGTTTRTESAAPPVDRPRITVGEPTASGVSTARRPTSTRSTAAPAPSTATAIRSTTIPAQRASSSTATTSLRRVASNGLEKSEVQHHAVPRRVVTSSGAGATAGHEPQEHLARPAPDSNALRDYRKAAAERRARSEEAAAVTLSDLGRQERAPAVKVEGALRSTRTEREAKPRVSSARTPSPRAEPDVASRPEPSRLFAGMMNDNPMSDMFSPLGKNHYTRPATKAEDALTASSSKLSEQTSWARGGNSSSGPPPPMPQFKTTTPRARDALSPERKVIPDRPLPSDKPTPAAGVTTTTNPPTPTINGDEVDGLLRRSKALSLDARAQLKAAQTPRTAAESRQPVQFTSSPLSHHREPTIASTSTPSRPAAPREPMAADAGGYATRLADDSSRPPRTRAVSSSSFGDDAAAAMRERLSAAAAMAAAASTPERPGGTPRQPTAASRAIADERGLPPRHGEDDDRQREAPTPVVRERAGLDDRVEKQRPEASTSVSPPPSSRRRQPLRELERSPRSGNATADGGGPAITSSFAAANGVVAVPAPAGKATVSGGKTFSRTTTPASTTATATPPRQQQQQQQQQQKQPQQRVVSNSRSRSSCSARSDDDGDHVVVVAHDDDDSTPRIKKSDAKAHWFSKGGKTDAKLYRGDVASRGGGGDGDAASGDDTTFQHRVLRSVIDDCLDEFRTQMRADVQNMHLDMIREFWRQKAEIQELLAAYSPNEVMIQELHELRRENARLRGRNY